MRKLLKKIIYFINDFRNSKNFKKNYGSFKGIYNNFNEARKNSPRSNVGYNNDESVERLMYRCEELKCKIQEPEYPLFFYLNRILNKNKQVNIIDLGGAFGVHYFKYINNAIHNNFNWTVIEVEKIALKGEEKFGNKNLSFVSSFKEIEGKDILISSGAIQYIENFSLNSVNNKPKHILFSRLPIQDRYKTFVTLQNAKSSFNPQYIFNKKEFISSYENMGYTLVDEWVSLSDKAIIPFNREKSCGFYSGFYFKLKGGSLE